MGVDVTLIDRDGLVVHRMPDPSGGIFDAAGNLDDAFRWGRWPADEEFPVWLSENIDPYGDTFLETGR